MVNKDAQLGKLLDYVANKSGTLLSTEYENCSQYFSIQCDKGHQWEAKFQQLISKETWCPICYSDRKNIGLEKLQSDGNTRECKICLAPKDIEDFVKINSTSRGYTCKLCFNLTRSENRLDYIYS